MVAAVVMVPRSEDVGFGMHEAWVSVGTMMLMVLTVVSRTSTGPRLRYKFYCYLHGG